MHQLTMHLSTQFNGTSTLDDNQKRAVRFPQGVTVAVLVMTVFFFVVGTIGNALVCFVISKRHDLRKVPHYLFLNLSIIGLVSSVFVMPFLIAIIARAYMMNSSEALDVLCKLRVFFAFFCSAINALSLSLMAIDRQDCVFRPFRRRIRKDNVLKILLTIWSTLITISIFFIITLSTDRAQCPSSDPFNLKSSFSESTILFSVFITVFGTTFNCSAILIIVITFVRITKKLRSSPLPESRSNFLRFEASITKLTYKTCGIFILSWFPVIISHSFARFSSHVDTDIIEIIKLVTLAFTNFTYAANPILHYTMLKVGPHLQPGHESRHQVVMRRLGSSEVTALNTENMNK